MAEWGKVYGSLHGSPKWRRASKPARALWTTAFSWCIDQEAADGSVPKDMLKLLEGTPGEAANLVQVGLWDVTETGWRFHDWHQRQRTREQIAQDRKNATERQRRSRTSRRDASDVSQRDAATASPEPGPVSAESGSSSPQTGAKTGRKMPNRDLESVSGPRGVIAGQGAAEGSGHGVTHAVSHAARTEESRGEKKRDTPSGVSEAAARPTARATQLHDDWQPTDDHGMRATALGLDLARETVKFRAHAQEKGRTAKNWNAAFTRWLINADEYAARDGRPGAARRRPDVGVQAWVLR